MTAWLWFGACAGPDQQLQQHQDKLASAVATAAAVGAAWLDGDVSSRYAVTALERAFQLVERERAALVQQPATLADPRAARLARDAEAASRALAILALDVRAADHAALRRHLAGLTAARGSHP